MLTDGDFQLLRHHLTVENDHDLEATLATLSPGCQFEDMALGQRFSGPDEVGRYYRMWWEGLAVTVDVERLHVVAGGPLVVVESTWRGEHVGPFLDVPATGRPVALPIVIVALVEGGLLAEERFYWDRLGLLQQLGAA